MEGSKSLVVGGTAGGSGDDVHSSSVRRDSSVGSGGNVGTQVPGNIWYKDKSDKLPSSSSSEMSYSSSFSSNTSASSGLATGSDSSTLGSGKLASSSSPLEVVL